MRPITEEELFADLWRWLDSEATKIEHVRQLAGGGGWEQWCVIEFLRWQLAAYPRGISIDYQRELEGTSARGKRRRFDIAYNSNPATQAAGHPLILTQWKAGNNGATLSMGAHEDIGTLVEFRNPPRVKLFIVALCPQPVAFAGSASLGRVSNTQVQLYRSTDETWKGFSGFTL